MRYDIASARVASIVHPKTAIGLFPNSFLNPKNEITNAVMPALSGVEVFKISGLAVILVAMVSCCGCLSSDASVDSRRVQVAAVRGQDAITQMHMLSLLEKHGIQGFLEGSLLYSLSVRQKDVTKSIELLRSDATKRGYWCRIGTRANPAFVSAESQDETGWKNLVVAEEYNAVLNRSEYASTTLLGAVMRDPHMMNAVKVLPYVVQIDVLDREYFRPDGALGQACEVVVFLKRNADDDLPWQRVRFQVMDEKMRVFYLGGNAGMATLSADKSSSTFDDDDARHKRLKPR